MNPTQRHKPPALKKSGERLYEDDHSGLAGDGLRKSATIAGAQFDRLVQVLAPEPLGLSRDIGEKLLFALQLIVIRSN